jgi:predicted helicase
MQQSGKAVQFDEDAFSLSTYRPFQKQWVYREPTVIERYGQWNSIFPNIKTLNYTLCVSGIGANKDFSCFITDSLSDVQLVSNGQCFPLYWYEHREEQTSLYGEGENYIRHDGVSDWIAKQARKAYGAAIPKEDIFYYVYGFLHNPTYRETFADDLKKSLPRIPLVESADDFWA